MDIETYRNYCLSLKGVTESFPFDENTLVFKVKEKMFSATDVDRFRSINLKCDPERAIELREKWPAVTPGYHMNKRHWNTIEMDDTIPDSLLYQLIKDSYDLVIAGLPRKEQQDLL
ncbi:MAG: MmcQ/YjbR family DNA-binding protein [Balneolales bacterium]